MESTPSKPTWIQEKEAHQAEKINRMVIDLEIDEDQKARIENIYKDANRKVQPLIDQKADIYKAAQTQIKTVLNNHQIKQWDAIRAQDEAK